MPTHESSRRRFARFRQAYREGHTESFGAEQTDSGSDRADGDDRRQYLRQYVAWIRPHAGGAGLLFGLSVIVAVLDMVQPLFMRSIIDGVLLSDELTKAEKYDWLTWLGAGFLLLIVIAKALEATRNLWQRLLNVRVMQSLRRALYDRLLHLPLEQLSDMKTGGIISRLTGDIDRTTGLLQLAVISPGVSVLRLTVALGILLALNWRLALAAMCILPPAVVLSLFIARRVRPIYRSMRKENAAIDARVSETFGGVRIVRAFQRENREAARYHAGRHTIIRKEMFAHRRELVLWSSWGLLLAGMNVVIVWMGGWMQISGQATVGTIMAFQWYAMLLLQPVWQIVNSFSEMQRSLAGMERVFEVLQSPAEKPDRPDAIAAPQQVEELKFDEVQFEYEPGVPVIRDLNLTVPGGSVVALVGRSGAGKTTVTDLIARFHDPTDGCILLNGVDLRDFRLASYRQLLGVVQQDTFLFDGTVRENIAYGRPHATDAEVEEAATRANAHRFICELTDGYDSIIGERGVRLSGGQAQRLSIARALLADPQILILDEATSNLDTESEQLIQQSLDELMHTRTTFVIAHRLSTVAGADLILVLEAGRVVERGTHAELMAAGGVYFDMVARQRDAMQSDFAELG
ncbi:MAG: ABC transporter ATP-binding protein [Planctomycetaceae bacterium]|nr:ABC transporter ATP-binding protein [Planctomycetaceae bacterium]